MGKYPELGRRFKPFVVEATGGWHRYSFDYLKLLASCTVLFDQKSKIVSSIITL
jgi:hypothetical protein